MGAFSHLTRRKFLKSAAAGAGAVAANKMLPSDLTAGGHQKIMPPNGRFKDIELTYFQDNNWLHAPLWLSETFQKDAGVSIKSRELYGGGDTVAKVLPQLLSRKPRFDWVQYPDLFFGQFAETGQLEPLDDYFAQYPSACLLYTSPSPRD